MEQITLPTKFREDAFDRVGAILKNRGIEETVLKAQLSRDFVDILDMLCEPSKAPLSDFADNKISTTQLRDASYFWGGVLCDKLTKTQLTPQHFSGTLSLAYSQMPQLYDQLVDRTSDILESFHRAYKSLEEEEKGVIKLFL